MSSSSVGWWLLSVFADPRVVMLGSPLPCPCKTPPPVWHPALSHPPIRPLISLRPSTFASSPPVSLKALPGPLPVCRETALGERWDKQDVLLYNSIKERILEMIQVLLWNYTFYYFFHRRNVQSTCEYCTAWKSRGQIKAKRTWDEAQCCGFRVAVVTSVCWIHLSCLKLLHISFFFQIWMKTALGQNALWKWLVYEEDFCT